MPYRYLFLAEITIFSIHWILMLFGIFIILLRFCWRFNFSDPLVPIYAASAVTCSVFCHLIYLSHESSSSYQRGQCPFLFTMFFDCTPDVSASFLWKWNVFTVIARLLGDVLTICASSLGQSAGAFFSQLFNQLPWLLYIPSIVICSIVIIFSVIAVYRYELRVFGGLFILRPTKCPSSPKSRAKCVSMPDNSVRVINELYQRQGCLNRL